MELLYLAAGIAIGILLGMSLQWRRSEAYIAELEMDKKALRDELDVQLDDDDDIDDFDQDDPEYVAGVEAVLRGWAEADAREANND